MMVCEIGVFQRVEDEESAYGTTLFRLVYGMSRRFGVHSRITLPPPPPEGYDIDMLLPL